MIRPLPSKRSARTGPRVCALACVIPFATASAAWDTVSDVRMGVEANDNPRLGQRSGELQPQLVEEQDHTAVRALMDARVRLTNEGPRGNFLVQPRVRADTYSDSADKDLQRQDAYLYLSGRHRWERGDVGTVVNAARESILSSEIIDTGLENVGDVTLPPSIGTDTGTLVLLDEHRNRTIVAPYVNFNLSERSSIGIDATYLDLTYTGPQFVGRSNISETEFGTSITRTIDERTGAGARIYVSDFTGKVTNNDTHTVGIQGRFSRKLNEIWSFEFAAGVERSSFTFVSVSGDGVASTPVTGTVVDNAAANYTLDLGITKRTDLATMTFALLRAMDPSATGFMTERNELQVAYSRRLSERITASFALRAVQTDALDDSERVSGRDISRAGIELDWAFTPTWSLAVSYEGISQNFEDRLRSDGTANLLSFGVNYRGLARPTAAR
ncbi:MAG TPA: hypothetical protein VFV10_03445 [Gammaproteobacteria bacterium]|nr:hypothetical protein [Gammaproteobacteria bacterium]